MLFSNIIFRALELKTRNIIKEENIFGKFIKIKIKYF